MDMGDLHVVLGASGGIGGAITRLLAERGQEVRAVSRQPGVALPGVTAVAADLTDRVAARAACDGASVVFHCAQPAYRRWAQEFPALTGTIADAAEAAGAKLVLADNLYMYAPADGPIDEDTPERPVSRKGEVRRVMAEDLLARHAAGRLRVAIGRASDYYGPGGVGSLSGAGLFGAALEGKPVRWPGDPDVPHATSYLPDIARALVTLAHRQEADGRAWVLPTAPALTTREMVALVADAVGRPVALKPTGKTMMRMAGLFVPEAGELPDIWHQFTRPWLTDGSRFDAAFGALEPTPHEVAVPATAAWWRDRAATEGA